jgi:hypothetical protein
MREKELSVMRKFLFFKDELEKERLNLSNLLKNTVPLTELQTVHAELLRTSNNLRDLLLEKEKLVSMSN